MNVEEGKLRNLKPIEYNGKPGNIAGETLFLSDVGAILVWWHYDMGNPGRGKWTRLTNDAAWKALLIEATAMVLVGPALNNTCTCVCGLAPKTFFNPLNSLTNSIKIIHIEALALECIEIYKAKINSPNLNFVNLYTWF